MYFFIYGGGGVFQKINLMRGGHAKKIGNWGRVIQFSNYTPPNPTSLPYPIKNERSLIEDEKKNLSTIPGGALGLMFARYVPLASQNPYPIIVYFLANYRPHLSHFLENVIFAIPT